MVDFGVEVWEREGEDGELDEEEEEAGEEGGVHYCRLEMMRGLVVWRKRLASWIGGLLCCLGFGWSGSLCCWVNLRRAV